MRRAIMMVLALASAGCHILTGFDELSLRDGAEHVWSTGFGDELPQTIDDAAFSSSRLRIAGMFEGTMNLSDSDAESLTAVESTRFVAQLDGDGGHDWSKRLDPGIAHHGFVPDTNLVTISHEDTVNFAGLLSLDAAMGTAFEVIDIAPDGTVAEVVFSGVAETLVSAHVAEAPNKVGILILGATFETELRIDDDEPVAACPVVSAVSGEMMPVQNIVVARIVNRECSWMRAFGDNQEQWLDAVGADNAGNIFMAGRFYGQLDFGAGEVLTSNGGIDYFIAKLSETGEAIWSHRFGHSGEVNQRPIQLSVRPGGAVTVAGYFGGTVDFGAGPFSASLGHDIFLARLDPSGNTVWAKHFEVRNDAPAALDMEDQVLSTLSLAVDGPGSTIIAGHFRANVDFGGFVRSSDGDLDMFLAKFNVDGRLEWSDGFGDGEDQCLFTDCVTALAIDDSDQIILGGGFAGSMDLGAEEELESAGESDAFLAKFAR